jgi:cell division transport system permease protein
MTDLAQSAAPPSTAARAHAGPGWRRDLPLVPPTSVAGRALVTTVAIMTFLAALAAGAAVLVLDASHDWRASVAREITIQVKPVTGRDLEADTAKAVALAQATPGVYSASPFSKSESEQLLQPWLGAGLDLADLPVPRLVVVALDPAHALDVAGLRSKLVEAVPGAGIDDHRLWLQRLATMARTMVLIAIFIFALILVAMGLAVSFATQGAMASNREIIEVLHFVGAADSYISRQFQSRFFRFGLRGGALGGGAAILVFFLSSSLTYWFRASAGAEQAEAMFGSFGLGMKGYLLIVGVAGGVAVLTGLVSRIIVFRHLRRLS